MLCYICNILLAMKPIDRKYEKFVGGQNKPWQDVLYVSLNKCGRIAMNSNCYKHLGKPLAAYLYYSRVDDTIALEPVHSHRMPTAFDVKQSGASGWRIDAAPFCGHHNIRLDKTERFIAPEIEDGRLYLKLGQTVTVQKRSTKRDRRPG